MAASNSIGTTGTAIAATSSRSSSPPSLHQDKYELETFSTSSSNPAGQGSPLLPPLSSSSASSSSSSSRRPNHQHSRHEGSYHDHQPDRVGTVYDDDNDDDHDDDDDEDDEYGDEETDLGPDGIISSSSAHTPISARFRRPNSRSKGSPSSSSSSSAYGRKQPNWLNGGRNGAPGGSSSGSLLSLTGSSGRLGWLERHRVFNLSVLTAVGTVILSIYFDIPSTLYIYLSVVFLAMPLSLAIDIRALAKRRRSPSSSSSTGGGMGPLLTRSRLMWIMFGLTPIFLWTWHPLSLLFFPSWDTESTSSSSLSSLTSGPTKPGPITGQHIPPLPASIQNRTYFFAANLYNVEPVLPAWTASILRVIERVGRENVYLSIYESNSKDGTKKRLTDFDAQLVQLGIPHRIRMDDESRRVGKEKGEWVGDRIEFLSKVRNVALKPLDEGIRGVKVGRDFDRVVWFNDVFMDPDQVVELLATNNGTWDQVCAFDYIPLGMYDTWVTRDVHGLRVKPMWPHFKELTDIAKLRARKPIEVNACWNGITAFDAKWYLDSDMSRWPRVQKFQSTAAGAPTGGSSRKSISNSSLGMVSGLTTLEARYDWPYDPPAVLPLRFRTSKTCPASECMLFSFDMHRLVRPLQHPTTPAAAAASRSQEQLRPLILMNPRVEVTYDWNAWVLYRHVMRWDMVRPWRVLWQDVVSHRMFGWVTDWGKKDTFCKEAFGYGWVELSALKGEEIRLPVAS
ncbi:hypothetical protein A4X09_0g156 [Tilletia walkeri]|uniref:Glycosyltransferase family 69 protein n=1 Tax=Tilletia walkeri TaxID=117179 RepID=A0A8X7NHT1_9BASI|nr:hypothetical protein A4X09_0g156 [Tilletia walkeri]